MYVDGKLTAGERHVLTTKWVGEMCERVKKQKDLIKRSFEKCGLYNILDRSEDALIKIKGIEVYKMFLLKRISRWLKKLTVKMMMGLIMNLKSRVQTRTRNRTRSSIVHVMYILLYIYDIWKRKDFIFNTRKRPQIRLPRISSSENKPIKKALHNQTLLVHSFLKLC